MGGITVHQRRNDRFIVPSGTVRCGLGEPRPDSPVGTLSFDGERGGRLTVFSRLSTGRLDDPNADAWFGNICCSEELPDDATADARWRKGYVTLLDAQLVRQFYGSPPDESSPRGGVSRESFYFSSAIVGAYVDDREHENIAGATVETEMLRHWVPTVYPTYEGGSGSPYRVTMQNREPIEMCSPLGDLSIRWVESESYGIDGLDLACHPVWSLRCGSPTSLAALEDEFVIPALGFMSLVTGWADGIVSVSVAGGRSEERGWGGRWHKAGWPTIDPVDASVRHAGFLLPFPDVEQDEVVRPIESWFHLASNHPQMRYISEALYARGSIVEQFMLLMGAIEQWYDVSRPSSRRVTDGDFKELKSTIREAVGEQQWRLIRDRISHAYLHDLRSKLTSIAEEEEGHFGKLALELPDFVANCVAYRNGMTHGWTRPRPMNLGELMWSTRMLYVLLCQDIMRHIGFGKDTVLRTTHQSALGQAITSARDNILIART